MISNTSISKFFVGAGVLFLLASCSKSNNNDANETPTPNTPAFTGANANAANLSVRVIYLVPSDRSLNAQYTAAAGSCITQLASWYKTALGSNKTFHYNTPLVETLRSTHPAAWFNADNGNSGTDAQFYFYANAKNDIKALLGTGYNETKFTYLVYVDAAGTTGAGALGFTAMPENDLKGLTGQMTEKEPRWVGGAGHELGHAFGLPHPANQNAQALMWTGYTLYPNCIFQTDDKTILNGSKFFY